MKVIKELKPFAGKRRLVVELQTGEELMAINPYHYYRLGAPLDPDVFYGGILLGARNNEVTWCSVAQNWV